VAASRSDKSPRDGVIKSRPELGKPIDEIAECHNVD